eukprot:s2124_g9.t1
MEKEHLHGERYACRGFADLQIFGHFVQMREACFPGDPFTEVEMSQTGNSRFCAAVELSDSIWGSDFPATLFLVWSCLQQHAAQNMALLDPAQALFGAKFR